MENDKITETENETVIMAIFEKMAALATATRQRKTVFFDRGVPLEGSLGRFGSVLFSGLGQR